MTRKGVSAVLLLCLSVNFAAGCKDKTIDYDIGINTESMWNAGKSGVEQFADAPAWEEEWTTENKKGDTVTLKVDADIILPQTGQLSVVEVMEPAFDAAYKETVAKRIFGDEEVCYNDICTPVDTYTANEYLGNRDGVPYELSFSEWDADRSSLRRIKTIKLAPKDVYQICPENLRETENLIYTAWPQRNTVENQCGISEEEARNTAQHFVDTLGLDYSVYAYSQPMVWANNSLWDEWAANGYVFTFDFGVDEISFVSFGREEDYKNFYIKHSESDELEYSLNAQMKVYVTEAGVIAMTADNPMEKIRISERVKLLPLDTIERIMKAQLTQSLEAFRFNYSPRGDLNFDEMELIYFRVRDKENPGYYSYVPAWRLSSASKAEEYHVISVRNPVLVNAMDGSVIDFYDET